MSEYVTYKDLGEIQKSLGSMEAKLGSLEITIREQHDSMVPFIKGVNDNINKLEAEDIRLGKKITAIDVRTDKFSFKFMFIWTTIIAVISFITQFISDKIAIK